MVDSSTMPGAFNTNTVLLFGSQALSFDAAAFSNLRNAIMTDPGSHWMCDAIASLPQSLETITSHFPNFFREPALSRLQDLNSWFTTGKAPLETTRLPNILLSPLVILSHLSQYSRYTRQINHDSSAGHQTWLNSDRSWETLGFCTGILSAFAVSTSKSQQQFQDHGSVALRLAMLIGLVVDTQENSNETGESQCFSAMWTSQEAYAEMIRILDIFPEVIVSLAS